MSMLTFYFAYVIVIPAGSLGGKNGNKYIKGFGCGKTAWRHQ